MIDGIIMLSGGLDSVCATHLLISQGLRLRGLHFVLPFYAGLGLSFSQVKTAAAKLGLPLQIIEEGEEYLPVIKDPKFGYGRNANPCIDCRIRRLSLVKKLMEQEGASFIATGEVLGQRPMSQRRDCLHKIENNAGLKGFILRPLSAKLLPPTNAENNGLVDREKLLGISGRGRHEQLAYAKRYGLVHGTPAGGCFLTEKVAANRLKDLSENQPDFNLDDFRLLAWGRHFRLSRSCKLVVGRDDPDNVSLEKIAGPEDYTLYLPDDIPGPFAVLRGPDAGEHLQNAAAIVGRYTRFKNEKTCGIEAERDGKKEAVTVAPAGDEECNKYRV